MMDNLEPLTTDGGRLVKMEVDYSATCDEKIAVAESLVANGKLQEALDTLLMLEKQTRTVSSFYSFLKYIFPMLRRLHVAAPNLIFFLLIYCLISIYSDFS